MYYRRKLLLGLLERVGGRRVGKINLQKLLFLLTRGYASPPFDFYPYRYGCYSSQADNDLNILARFYGLVKNDAKHWRLNSDQTFFAQLRRADQTRIDALLKSVNPHNANELIGKVYEEYPYYAIKSSWKLTARQSELRAAEIRKIGAQSAKRLFSIGYEGASIDAYLDKLVKNNVAALCDVRQNPISRKYGFSKKQLAAYCARLEIEYIHIPQLGIESDDRRGLASKADYDALFAAYKADLRYRQNELERLKSLFARHRRIALTCFERDPAYCHRGVLITHYQTAVEGVGAVHL